MLQVENRSAFGNGIPISFEQKSAGAATMKTEFYTVKLVSCVWVGMVSDNRLWRAELPPRHTGFIPTRHLPFMVVIRGLPSS